MSIRIYALAKHLSIDSKQLVSSAAAMGFSHRGSALAELSTEEASRLATLLRPDLSAKEIDALLRFHEPNDSLASPIRKKAATLCAGQLSQSADRLAAIREKLTSAQLVFLGEHEISLELLFDASGMSRARYQQLMKTAGRPFAIGVSQCANGHQSIRSRAGHCILCDPGRIPFQLRHDATGNLYIAGSKTEGLLKIGCTGHDALERTEELNKQCYGGIDNWELLLWADRIPRAGEKELLIHGSLNAFRRTDLFYEKNGRQQLSYEVFSCSYSTASSAFKQHVPTLQVVEKHKRFLLDFEFNEKLGIKQKPRVGNRGSSEASLTPFQPATKPNLSRDRFCSKTNEVIADIRFDFVENENGAEVESTFATCTRCGNESYSFGNHAGSIKRCLAELHDTCELDEDNFYVEG